MLKYVVKMMHSEGRIRRKTYSDIVLTIYIYFTMTVKDWSNHYKFMMFGDFC